MTTQTDIKAFYQRADDNMRDLPVYNPALSVFCSEPVITPCQHPLYVVVTPWCMNLVLLHSSLPDNGESMTLTLPSGIYTFTIAEAEVLGCYGICSLFSPMWEFSEQAVAEETAIAALNIVIGDEQPTKSERQLLKDERQRRAEALQEQQAWERAAQHEAKAQTSSAAAKSLNRRAFLHGKFSSTSADAVSEKSNEHV